MDMGKRIAQRRKELGWTQDQLAEKLGVTAQAVSKWENDQSCPDIATLPALADLLGLSVDELLGRMPKEPVHEGQVEQPESFEFKSGGGTGKVTVGNGKVSFTWDSGKVAALAAAVWILLTGVLLAAAELLSREANFWAILWPTALLVFGGAYMLRRFTVLRLGVCLAGLYFLVSNLGILPEWLENKNFLMPLLLVLLGLGLLVDVLRRARKPMVVFSYDGSKRGRSGQGYQVSADGTHFTCSGSFSENTWRVDLPLLSGGTMDTSFGDYTLDLSGVRTLAEDCHIRVAGSFGETTILVPRRFAACFGQRNASFGACQEVGAPDPEPEGYLTLDANVSFGDLTVRYLP